MNNKALAILGFAVLGAFTGATASAQDNGVPYQAHRSAEMNQYGYGNLVQFNTDAAVPAGKRLIIESISIRTWLPSTQGVMCTLQQNGQAKAFLPKLIPTHPVLASTNMMESTANLMTKVYIDAGDFRVSCERKVTGGSGWVNVIVSGTLVDAL